MTQEAFRGFSGRGVTLSDLSRKICYSYSVKKRVCEGQQKRVKDTGWEVFQLSSGKGDGTLDQSGNSEDDKQQLNQACILKIESQEELTNHMWGVTVRKVS